jgi:hypothetical protein
MLTLQRISILRVALLSLLLLTGVIMFDCIEDADMEDSGFGGVEMRLLP